MGECYAARMEPVPKPRRGRRAVDEAELRAARIDVRMPPQLRRRVRVAAAKRDLGMSTWALEALEEKLAREGG